MSNRRLLCLSKTRASTTTTTLVSFAKCLHLVMMIFVSAAVESSDVVTPVAMETKFVSNSRCLGSYCAKESRGLMRSLLECSLKCADRNGCLGIQYDQNRNCLLLKRGCFLNDACSSGQIIEKVFERRSSPASCLHNGTWDDYIQSCRCVDGWVGPRCERLPYNCDEVYEFWYPYGHQRVLIDINRNMSLVPMIVCYGNEWGTSTYIFVNNGSPPGKNESWSRFVEGYIHGEWDFWIGLETILAFNRQGFRKVIFAVDFYNTVTNDFYTMQWEYSNFWIEDASSGYAFTSEPGVQLPSYTRYFLSRNYSLMDSLTSCIGQPFQTHDVDRGRGCASTTKSGWWFPDCGYGSNIVFNPLGYNPKETSDARVHYRLPNIDVYDQQVMDTLYSIALSFPSRN